MSKRMGWPASIVNTTLHTLRGRVAIAPDALDIGRGLSAALGWILAAHEFASDGGIPAHFDLLRNRWTASYPETTGYTVPTLLAAAMYLGRLELHSLALELADYLLAVRTAEGGVANWEDGPGQEAPPIVFDTGQVIFGWLAAWRDTRKQTYLDGAILAGDWLVSVQDAGGAWLRHQHRGVVKVIDVRVAWALLCLADATGRDAYREAARRNLEWTLAQQLPNGWFSHAGFEPDEDPYTHAIAYTAEGLLESGLLLREPRYVAAAEVTARALLECQRPDGALASTYADDWRPTARSSCLTGDCQAALLWLRLAGLGAHTASAGGSRCCEEPHLWQSNKLETDPCAPGYLAAAQRAIAFVASTQDLVTDHPGVRGGIAGSYPIYGRYGRFKYPNWAAKFFTDALLALDGEPTPKQHPG